MKISDGSVAMNVPPFVSIAFSGAMTKAKICWMKMKATAQPTTSCNHRHDQSPSQLVEMLEERHPSGVVERLRIGQFD